MVKIRLQRGGAKRRPFYRIVAIDQRRQRDGRALAFLGTYDPKTDPPSISLQHEQIDAWVARGAQLSDTVASLVKRSRGTTAAAPAAGAEA